MRKTPSVTLAFAPGIVLATMFITFPFATREMIPVMDVDWERGDALALRDGDDVFLSLRRARVFSHAA